ncbi:hypothetical protein BGZ96_003482 [Linnemannia gamsii]|uniref:F-box domain-containing protein n=1 Tax=Linnemannia gamsii TaxID=64522 RepID=A0ABQ7K8P7_9FUNG|nr:hypothetical protein BGZ96_003482 [Linnemannia gamsii]
MTAGTAWTAVAQGFNAAPTQYDEWEKLQLQGSFKARKDSSETKVDLVSTPFDMSLIVKNKRRDPTEACKQDRTGMSQPAQKAKKKKKERAPKVFDHNYAKVTHVPELVEHILSFLSQRSLRLSASLVCQLWHTVALPLLVPPATITLDPANQAQLDPLNKDRNKFDQNAIDGIRGARVLVVKSPVADPFWGRLGPPRLGPLHHQAFMKQLDDLAQQNELRVIDLQVLYYMDYQTDILPLLTVTGFQLTNLQLKRMHFSELLPLDKILLLCPRLLHLKISQSVPSYYRLADSSSSDHSPSPSLPNRIPLRSLSLDGIGIEIECFLQLLRVAPALTDLALTKLISGKSSTTTATPILQAYIEHLPPQSTISPSPSTKNSTPLKKQDLVSWSNMAAIERIATASPQITRLSISMNKPSKIKSTELAWVLQKFPYLTHWVTPSFDISSQTLGTFRTSTFADRMTSLEITGHLNQEIVGRALHQYLCGATHLQHLRASGMRVSIAWLDVEGILNTEGRYLRKRDDDGSSSSSSYFSGSEHQEQLQARVWTTSNLKTLHLSFGAGRNGDDSFDSYEGSRMVYGYISKTCPRLQDLSISSTGLLLSLEGGVSLLSRLQELRRVVVITESREDLKKDDLGWLTLDMEPARNVEKKRLLERFITVEDRTIYSRTPFQSTLLSQDQPAKGRQKHLKPTIKEVLSCNHRYREQKSKRSDTETESDSEEADHPTFFKKKKKASAAVSTASSPVAGDDGDGDNSPDYMVSGADMRGLGHLQDIGTMFLNRSRHRWQCWPELEYLEFQNYPHRLSDDNDAVMKWKAFEG